MADENPLPPWNKPFAEQLDFFKKKLNLPSERWDDIAKSGHDKSFMITGAQSADFLKDMNSALVKAMDKGTGLKQFQKDFEKAVRDSGWTGWTGEGTQAGTAWRAKVIYQTNMTQSYNAGRLAQMLDPDSLKVLPYLQYFHRESSFHPRPEHLSWHGLTLPHDHNFWITHSPQNGWGCQCGMRPVGKAAFLKAIANGKGPANAPAPGDLSGIDEGFEYQPGAGIDKTMQKTVQEKLITYPPAIAKALSHETNQYINTRDPVADFVRKALKQPSGAVRRAERSFRGFVENPAPISKSLGEDATGMMVTIPEETPRAMEQNAGEQAPTPEDYAEIMNMLAQPDEIAASQGGEHKQLSIVKKIKGKAMVAIFDVLAKDRTLSLVSLLVQAAI